jgi:hypothetical protein
MLRIILIAVLACMPLAARAADEAPFVSGHKGETLVEVNGHVKWLTAEELSGLPWWLVKVQCYRGADVVGETELQVWDGYTGVAEGSSTHLRLNPYTGRRTPKTRIGYFVYADSRRPEPYFVAGADPHYRDLLARVPAATLGPLTLYVYCEGADRFEAQVYQSRTAGYSLDRTPLIPLAQLNDDTEPTLYGRLSGQLTGLAQPLYILRPLIFSPTSVNGKGLIMLHRPDGSIELVKPEDLALPDPLVLQLP